MLAVIVTPEHSHPHNSPLHGKVHIQVNSRRVSEKSIVEWDESLCKIRLRIKFNNFNTVPDNLVIKITNSHETKRTVIKKIQRASLYYTITLCKIKLDKISVSYAA